MRSLLYNLRFLQFIRKAYSNCFIWKKFRKTIDSRMKKLIIIISFFSCITQAVHFILYNIMLKVFETRPYTMKKSKLVYNATGWSHVTCKYSIFIMKVR